MVHARKGPSKILKRPGRQTSLHEPRPEPQPPVDEQVAPHEMKLEPIVDKRSYDRFIKAISLRTYAEFERSMRSEGMAKPELHLVSFDLVKVRTPADVRMADYILLNTRLIVERAFADMPDYVSRHMPRVMREMAANGGDLATYVESKVQRDLVMEIRVIALQHIPEHDRFRYRSKLKDI